jgi:uncharacterized protein
MNHRTFGNIPFSPSSIGFGAMRLPVVNGDFKTIDEAPAIEMLRYAIDHGVNYLDTAYPYHGGNSEVVLGKALRDGYREKVKIADKMPTWLVNESADFDKYFAEQKERLGVDKIDFYLLHALAGESWRKMRDLGAIAWLEARKAAGDIDWFGFSFHGPYTEFVEIVDGCDHWDFCMIQYNWADVDVQAGIRGLKYAHEKGLGVVIMEPLRGGDLVRGIPEYQLLPFTNLHPERTLPDWGLRWLWNQPEVAFMISGMSSMEQVEENIRLASEIQPPYLTDKDLEAVSQVKTAVENLKPIRCTFCGYCRECPQGISIPFLFDLYNDYRVYRNAEKTRFMLSYVQEDHMPQKCLKCQKCLSLCPQGTDIPRWLDVVAGLYAELGIKTD